MTCRIGTLLLLASMLLISVARPGGAAQPSARFLPPSFFVGTIDNPYLPLPPGTTFIYEGQKEGIPARNETTVTRDAKVILGVTCTVVQDLAFENDVLVEETFDWYAQDVFGNVWYFGEDATEFPSGSKEGSWEGGVEGALPGIVMKAHPRVGDRYRQENAPDVAQDMAKVLSLNRSLCVPFGCFGHLLQTKEWTPFEPGVVEQKYYARGVGFIKGVMVKGGSELTELVAIVSDAAER